MDPSTTLTGVSLIANNPQKLLDLYASLGDLDGYVLQKKVNRYVSLLCIIVGISNHNCRNIIKQIIIVNWIVRL